MRKKYFLALMIMTGILLCSSQRLFAQETKTETKAETTEEREKFVPHHSIGLAVSHAHVFNGRDENGKKKTLNLSAWAIDYNYYFAPKWAVGLHTDIIAENFMVENSENETIERSYPIAPALMGIFRPNRHWSLLAGVGEEFAKEENYFLTRFGVEYGGELRKGWELFGNISYDIKWKGYDTWILGLGISKSFGKRLQKD
jgi:hypothetical protein